MQQQFRGANPKFGQDHPGNSHHKHRNDPNPHFAARQTTGGIGRLEHQMDIEDCTKPEKCGDQVQVTNEKMEATGGNRKGRSLAIFLETSGEFLAGCGQLPPSGRIKVADGAGAPGLLGVLLGGNGCQWAAQHKYHHELDQ